jgi:hypothetical protein
MTLKQKFRKAFGLPRITDYGCELMEKVADEFAIGFLNWYKIHGKWITKHLEDFELLDLYKKEKQL